MLLIEVRNSTLSCVLSDVTLTENLTIKILSFASFHRCR